MRRIKLLCFGLSVMFLLASPWAQGQGTGTAEYEHFTNIDFPGATGTLALDINSAGEIVGRYGIAGTTHGFLRSTEGVFTTIDFPGAAFTVAAGINRQGEIVGMYSLPGDPPDTRHGFLRDRRGRFISFDPPGSTFTNVLGINSRGDIVGRFCVPTACGDSPRGTGFYHGFLLSGGEFTTFDFPGADETHAWKINPRGQIVGGYRVKDKTHLFLLREGEFTTIDLPSAILPALDNGGINSRGDIVGVHCDTAPCTLFSLDGHGFLLSRGAFTSINLPGVLATHPLGINTRGDIAGSYRDRSLRFHAFLLRRRE